MGLPTGQPSCDLAEDDIDFDSSMTFVASNVWASLFFKNKKKGYMSRTPEKIPQRPSPDVKIKIPISPIDEDPAIYRRSPAHLGLPALPGSPRSLNPDDISELASVRALEKQIEVETKERKFQQDTFWRSCCGSEIDQRVCTVSLTAFFSLLALLFCMFIMVTADQGHCVCDGKEEDITMYWGLFSMIITAYITNSVNKRKDKD